MAASRSSSSSSKVSDGSSEVTASPSSPSSVVRSLSHRAGEARGGAASPSSSSSREAREATSAATRARVSSGSMFWSSRPSRRRRGSFERSEPGERLELDVSRVGARRAPPRRRRACRGSCQGLGAHRGEGVEVAAGGAELRAELEGVRLESCALVRVVVRVEGRRVGHRRRHLVRRDPGRYEHGVSGRVASRARISAIPGDGESEGGAVAHRAYKGPIHVDASADAREEVCAVVSQRGAPREKNIPRRLESGEECDQNV